MRAELEAMLQQMKDLLERQEAAAATPVTVVVRREGRLHNVSGSGADPVSGWVEGVCAMVSAQRLADKETTDYLISDEEADSQAGRGGQSSM